MLLATFAIAACGDDSSDDGGGGTVPAEQATVSTREVAGYGTALVTRSDKPVYLLTSDRKGASRCTGKCERRWQPLTARGKPKAGPGTEAAKLSTFKRRDGKQQVAYNGHPLYIPRGSASTSWAGTESNGGFWYLVSPSGEAIETTSSGGY